MPSFEQQISQRVQAFVSEITELARRQALETLSTALAAGGAAIGAGRGRGRKGNGHVASAGGRRSADQIEATSRALIGEITARPGQRVEQIGGRLGRPTRELALPLRKLVRQKRIRTEGQRRATKYFPAGEGGARRGKRRTRGGE
jgi:hypothetical protein